MIGLLRQLATGALAPVRQAARRTALDIALIIAAAILVVIALVFGAISATHWLSLRFGFIQATAIMSSVFLVAAIVVLGVRMMINRRAQRPLPQAAAAANAGLAGAASSGIGQALGGRASGGLSPEELALLGTRDMVKTLTPFQLTLVAALAGFVGGRILDKKK